MLSISNRTFRAFSSQLLARLPFLLEYTTIPTDHWSFHHLSSLFYITRCYLVGSLKSPLTIPMVIAIRSQSTLIVAEHNNEKLNAATLHAVTAASQLGGEVGQCELLCSRNEMQMFFSSHLNFSGELLGGRNWLCSCCQGGCISSWGFKGENRSWIKFKTRGKLQNHTKDSED